MLFVSADVRGGGRLSDEPKEVLCSRRVTKGVTSSSTTVSCQQLKAVSLFEKGNCLVVDFFFCHRTKES